MPHRKTPVFRYFSSFTPLLNKSVCPWRHHRELPQSGSNASVTSWTSGNICYCLLQEEWQVPIVVFFTVAQQCHMYVHRKRHYFDQRCLIGVFFTAFLRLFAILPCITDRQSSPNNLCCKYTVVHSKRTITFVPWVITGGQADNENSYSTVCNIIWREGHGSATQSWSFPMSVGAQFQFKCISAPWNYVHYTEVPVSWVIKAFQSLWPWQECNVLDKEEKWEWCCRRCPHACVMLW